MRALLWTLAIHGLILLFFVVRVSWEQQSKASAPMMVELWEELPQPPARPTPVPAPLKPAPKAAPKPPPLLPKADIALKKEEKAKPEEKKEPVPPKKENVVKKMDNPEPKEPPKKTVVAQKEELPKAPEKLNKEATKPEPKKTVKATKQEPPKEEPPKKEPPKKELPKQETAPKAPPKQPQKKVAKAQETPKPAPLAKPVDSTAQGRANMPSSSTVAGHSTGTSLQGAVLNGYIQKIQTKIYRYMNTTLCGPGNWEVIASVRLIPGGTLLATPEISKSSGMAACDRAIIAAIMQAEPLPVPEDPMLFSQFRHLNLKFRPQ